MENNKINIVKILKDCPKGMKLNCTIYENVEFDFIDETPEAIYPIHCLLKTNTGNESVVFTNDGCIYRHPNAKCVIFPENKDTWEGFEPPIIFKDGDIVSDKFNINTLIPFESKILVRNFDDQIWKPAIFGGYIIDSVNAINSYYMTIGGISYLQLIPYEGNEHLCNKSNNCSNYYKTWKK